MRTVTQGRIERRIDGDLVKLAIRACLFHRDVCLSPRCGGSGTEAMHATVFPLRKQHTPGARPPAGYTPDSILVHETLVEALTRGAPDHAQIEGLRL